MASREEIYERIRQSSKEEYILDEMIRLGFWPRDAGMPEDPREEIRRRQELEQLLKSLTTEGRRLADVEKARQELRKRRMQESRQRRKETKV
jgi:hypothetical protein